jgi:hypothetical protein
MKTPNATNAFGVFNETYSLLSGFDNFARLDAPRAYLHPAVATRGKLYADRLKIRIEPPAGFVISVGNIVSELRSFPANVASLCHMIIASKK